jgi:hypothetical protein
MKRPHQEVAGCVLRSPRQTPRHTPRQTPRKTTWGMLTANLAVWFLLSLVGLVAALLGLVTFMWWVF